MQRLADVKFKIHNHNTTQKTGHSSLVFVLWKPHSKRVTVGTFLQTISLPLADVAARGTTNHPPSATLAGSDCGHGSSRRGRELSAARGGSQCSCGRRGSRLGLAILGDWERSFGFFWCFGCSFSAVAGRILPTSLWLWWLRWFWWSWWSWWFWWFDDYDDYDDYDYDHFDDYKHVSLYWTHVLDIALARLAFWTYQAFWSHGQLRWCLQGELAAESGNTAMKSAEIAAKAVLVTGETFFFQRSENGYEGWIYPPGFQSTTRMITFFRFGNPNLKPPLPLAQAATKSAAASGLPPYQAVEPTATCSSQVDSPPGIDQVSKARNLANEMIKSKAEPPEHQRNTRNFCWFWE